MQLDRTHVVVRLRTMSEIGDLALVMIRRYPGSCAAFAAGASIWALANAILLGWIPIGEYQFGLEDEEAFPEILRYVLWMAVLVVLQTPAAGVLMTSYLGQAVFEETPDRHAIVKETRRHVWRWLWVLGVKRFAFPTMLLLILRWGTSGSLFWDATVPLVILGTTMLVRAYRPFLPEILLLERCPLKADTEAAITVSKRSHSLHRPVSGDMSGRFLAISFVMVGMFLSLFYSLMFARGIITGLWNSLDLVVLLVIYPLSLWLVAGLSVLIRFLVYLDTRIRLEGWEVELAVQAEAIRQFSDSLPNANPVNREPSGRTASPQHVSSVPSDNAAGAPS